jgi:hypothetical protein
LKDTLDCFAGTTDRLAIAAMTRHHRRKQNSDSCLEIEIIANSLATKLGAISAGNAHTIASVAPK